MFPLHFFLIRHVVLCSMTKKQICKKSRTWEIYNIGCIFAQGLGVGVNRGRNLLWGRWAAAPGPPFTPPPPRLKFFIFKNLVKTKIGLHNSSIHRNRSVLISTPFLLWYYMAHSFLFRFTVIST